MHLVIDKDGSHTIKSAIPENPMIHAILMALCFIEMELRQSKFYIAEVGIFDLFAPVTLLDPYSTEICWMCKYELPTLRLSKVTV